MGRGVRLDHVNGSRPVVLVELRRAGRWRVLAALVGVYCPRCGRWWRHTLVCPLRKGAARADRRH
jgi:hypothetical protein